MRHTTHTVSCLWCVLSGGREYLCPDPGPGWGRDVPCPRTWLGYPPPQREPRTREQGVPSPGHGLWQDFGEDQWKDYEYPCQLPPPPKGPMTIDQDQWAGVPPSNPLWTDTTPVKHIPSPSFCCAVTIVLSKKVLLRECKGIPPAV